MSIPTPASLGKEDERKENERSQVGFMTFKRSLMSTLASALLRLKPQKQSVWSSGHGSFLQHGGFCHLARSQLQNQVPVVDFSGSKAVLYGPFRPETTGVDEHQETLAENQDLEAFEQEKPRPPKIDPTDPSFKRDVGFCQQCHNGRPATNATLCGDE